MRIAINISGQFKPMTGIQHSIDSLIHHLYLDSSQVSGQNELTAFAAELTSEAAVEEYAKTHPGTFEWRDLPGVRFDTKSETIAPTLVPERFQRDHPWLSEQIHQRERKVLRHRFHGPRERVQDYDVFHSPEPVDMSFSDYNTKKVATLYDIATHKFPENYTPTDIGVWQRYFDFAVNHCVHVVAISEATKHDCMEAFGFKDEQITVTPLAARASAKRLPDSAERRALLKEWELDDVPFVLYTGTLEPRKNLFKLIKAFSEAVRQDPTLPHKLVLAGGNWNRLDIELRLYALECGLSGGRLVTTGYVSNTQLNAFMSACDVFAYVSLYEGFGMPPLEAMTCGAPVVTSNTSSLPEVVGDAGIQVDPKNTQEMAAALHLLMSDRAENARRRELSLARAQTFTWARTARLTMEAYEKAASR